MSFKIRVLTVSPDEVESKAAWDIRVDPLNIALGADPRPDLDRDGALWSRLLSLAAARDGGDPFGLYGALHGLRCGDAEHGPVALALVTVQGATVAKLLPACWTARHRPGEDCEQCRYYAEQRERWLVPQGVALVGLLREVGRDDGTMTGARP